MKDTGSAVVLCGKSVNDGVSTPVSTTRIRANFARVVPRRSGAFVGFTSCSGENIRMEKSAGDYTRASDYER